VGYTENDLKLMGVKRWRKKPEDRFVWAIILKEALVKPTAQYANEEVVEYTSYLAFLTSFLV
jgi:hypothetical protein